MRRGRSRSGTRGILDTADEAIERLARALREREPGESVTEAALRSLELDLDRSDDAPDELNELIPMFAAMLDSTPPLRAAWLDLQNRVAVVAAEELARRADVDPESPEPMIAGRALAGLGQVMFDSRVRHIEAGLRGTALGDAVKSDIDRAARLLETGLWSLHLLAQGRRTQDQIQEAARTAEEARKQVLRALRQARTAWRELREQKR